MENKYGIEIIMIDNEFYALNGWNGSEWNDCWKTDKSGNEILDGNQYRIRPIFTMVDEDGYEIDSYELLF